MSFSRILFFACTLLCTAAFAAHAQTGGSTYSMLGLGDLRYLPGARSAGMGYTGIGLSSSQYINPTAPATWTRISRTRVDASVLYEGFNTTDGRVSRYLAETNFAGALMAIPISPLDGIVMVTGFTPYSNVDFNLATAGSYGSGSDQIDYTLRHVGTGGLGQGLLGLSWAPSDQWSLGASINYVFGTIDKVTSMTTTQTTLATGVVTETANMHAVLANVGVLYSGFTGPLSPLSIGFNATSPGILNSTRNRKFVYSGGGQSISAFDTLQLSNGTITIPIALGFGFSWALGERLIFAADYRIQTWGSAEFYGETPRGLRNSQMAGIGFERAPSRDPSASFVNHLAYRLGFTYNASYYSIKGVPIDEWVGTGGLSVPISGDTRLNLSAEFGVRGKMSSNLVKDKVFRFTASLTLGEMWFVRPEED
jgi:hypothetical protein